MIAEPPLVSIICAAYNHENFIARALEGFINQITTFSFEIIAHDDASTDNTATLLKNYEKKYPHLFSNIYQTENQFSKSDASVIKITFAATRGKYIALCEGDDYWTDPFKLQKQVDFLEASKNFAICFHNTEELFDDVNKPSFLYCSVDQKELSSTEDLLQFSNFIPTCSAVFRNHLIGEFPRVFAKLGMGDWIIHTLNSQYGNIKYINEVMGVHRIHAGGIWSGSDNIKNSTYILKAYEALRIYFKNNKKLFKIADQKYKEYLYLVYNLHKQNKNKKEAFQYFKKIISVNPFTVFHWSQIKEFIKIYIK